MYFDFVNKYKKNRILFDLETLIRYKIKNIYVFPTSLEYFTGVCFENQNYYVFYLQFLQNKDSLEYFWKLKFCKEELCENANSDFECVSLIKICTKIKNLVNENKSVICSKHSQDIDLIFNHSENKRLNNVHTLKWMIEFMKK